MFKNIIEIDSFNIMSPYLKSFDYKTSGTTATSMYMWRAQNDYRWEIIGDYLVVALQSYLESGEPTYFMMPPMTKTGSYDKEALRYTIEQTKKIFESQGEVFKMRLVPSHMTEIISEAWDKRVELIEDRVNHDYVYLRENLAELKGKDYHSKKNHLNYFKNNFEYEYSPLKKEDKEDVMRFLGEFNSRKEVSEHQLMWLNMETDAMGDVISNLDKIGYFGGVIRIDGKVEAFTIGARLNENTVDVHVEKANTEIRGLYPAINNEFAKSLTSDIIYVNREEDMGIENLRKAKLSYKPVELVEKFIIEFK